jgi:uncharacterized protein (DUF697 family)
LFDESGFDAEKLFSHERQREMRELGHANILVIGQTGVGKSTLVNAVFRKPLAKAGAGRPVTKTTERFDDPDVPVTLYDTKGVELGDSKRRVIRDFKRVIETSRKGGVEDHIHLLWFCIHPDPPRIQDYEIDIIRALAEDVPVILIYTHTVGDELADQLDATVDELELPIEGGHAVRTLADARRIGRQTLHPRGLEELVRLTTDVLPDAVSRAFVSAQGVVIDLKTDQARAVVVACVGAAAAVAAAPVPIPDATMLLPVQLGMLAGVTAIFGIDLSADQAKELLGAVTGTQQGVQKFGKMVVDKLADFVPGGGVLNATVAAALTGALGEAYVRLCVEMLRREAAGKPMPDAEMLRFFIASYEGIIRKPRRTKQRDSVDHDPEQKTKPAPPSAPKTQPRRARPSTTAAKQGASRTGSTATSGPAKPSSGPSRATKPAGQASKPSASAPAGEPTPRKPGARTTGTDTPKRTKGRRKPASAQPARRAPS